MQYILNSAGIGCHIYNCCTNHVLYANDQCVITPSTCGVHSFVNIFAMFDFKNDIVYNPIKCMVFKPRGFHLKCPDINVNFDKHAYVNKAKYLGVTACNDLKDDEDILRHLRNFYARYNSTLDLNIVPGQFTTRSEI